MYCKCAKFDENMIIFTALIKGELFKIPLFDILHDSVYIYARYEDSSIKYFVIIMITRL